jgi:CBS domain-containing protein
MEAVATENPHSASCGEPAGNYGWASRRCADVCAAGLVDDRAMTQELVSSPERAESSGPLRVADELSDDLLEREVRDFMTPGCVTISEDASVADAAEALARHRVHAVLVVGARNGTPLGWVTARGLLNWLGRDRSLVSAREAITEQVTAIYPHERLRVALYALSLAGTTHLLVRRKPHQSPEGVITDFDLAVAAGR